MAVKDFYNFQGSLVQIMFIEHLDSKECRILYRNSKNIYGGWTGEKSEINEYFKKTDDKFIAKSEKTKDILNLERYNIEYWIGSKHLETVKRNLTKSQAYTIKNSLKNLDKYRTGKLLIKKI